MAAKPSKCEWAKAACTHLRHTVGAGHTCTALEDYKVKVIKKFLQPKMKGDIESFHSFVGYYSKFIRDLPVIPQPSQMQPKRQHLHNSNGQIRRRS